jgi:hypothetical protein
MSIIDSLLGNASEVSTGQLQKAFDPILVTSEKIQKIFRIWRDMFVFTDRRLIIVDKQGLTGTKVSYMTIPYKNITKFQKENAGTFDIDAELKIWVLGSNEALVTTFKRGSNIDEVYQLIGEYVLK